MRWTLALLALFGAALSGCADAGGGPGAVSGSPASPAGGITTSFTYDGDATVRTGAMGLSTFANGPAAATLRVTDAPANGALTYRVFGSCVSVTNARADGTARIASAGGGTCAVGIADATGHHAIQVVTGGAPRVFLEVVASTPPLSTTTDGTAGALSLDPNPAGDTARLTVAEPLAGTEPAAVTFPSQVFGACASIAPHPGGNGYVFDVTVVQRGECYVIIQDAGDEAQVVTVDVV